MLTCPVCGVMKPATTFSTVDLPQPDGPEHADELAGADVEAHMIDGNSSRGTIAEGDHEIVDHDPPARRSATAAGRADRA